MSDTIIRIENLSKVYSSLTGVKVNALNDVSLQIGTGEIFGLLGPNGAGKTTLIKILLGITRKTNGNVSVFGTEPENYSIRKLIGYLPENHKFPEYLTAYDFLKFTGELYGLFGKELDKKIDEYLHLVQMTKWKKTKLKSYSKGMLQRIGLAQAILHSPKLIILDEPTDGVDPIGRKEIRELLNRLKEEGKTVFINSHLLSEVELISDRVAILNNGEKIFEGKVDELTKEENLYQFEFGSNPSSELINKLAQFNFKKIDELKYSAEITSKEELNSVLDLIRGNGADLESFSPVKSSLEDKFISLIQKVGEE